MSNVLSVTAPIYLLILAGYVAVWLEWMVPTDLRVLGRFVAQFCVPALLFRALSRQPFAEVLHGDYVAVYAGGSLVALATVTLFARFVRGRPMSLAALQGLGSSGSNSSFVGYPIVEQLIGPTAGVALAMCTLVENLIVMPLALAMADSEGGGGRPRDALMAALRGLVRNPMILAILAGLALSASGLHLPSVLDRTVEIAAAAAPPTALFVIGGSLVGLRLAGIRGDLALVTFGKLAFHPLCVLGFMLVLPIRDPALRAAAVLFAAMPMLSIYPVLAQKHGHERFCAAALLAATVVSFVSISALIGIIPVWQGTR
jgi:predicted permease